MAMVERAGDGWRVNRVVPVTAIMTVIALILGGVSAWTKTQSDLERQAESITDLRGMIAAHDAEIRKISSEIIGLRITDTRQEQILITVRAQLNTIIEKLDKLSGQ